MGQLHAVDQECCRQSRKTDEVERRVLEELGLEEVWAVRRQGERQTKRQGQEQGWLIPLAHVYTAVHVTRRTQAVLIVFRVLDKDRSPPPQQNGTFLERLFEL